MVPTYNEVLYRQLDMISVIINNSEKFHQSIVRWKKVEFKKKKKILGRIDQNVNCKHL